MAAAVKGIKRHGSEAGVFMEAAYRIAVLVLLAGLIGAAIYESEKITANQYQFSSYDVQRVEVVKTGSAARSSRDSGTCGHPRRGCS